ncbi:MAG: GntR family transcriptional regulator [Chloroflexi bacterium]|nr:GntR family transcriptional regulator [Chloroflexota bacterium]
MIAARGPQSGPMYRRVADDIVMRIDAAIWPAGTKLPSERELCAEYDVSQITVRRALRELTHDGRVYSRHGLGWFVAEPQDRDEMLHEVALVLPQLDRFAADLVERLAPLLRRRGAALRLHFGATEEEHASALLRAQHSGAEVILDLVAGPEQGLAQSYARCLRELSAPVLFVMREVPNLRRPAVVLDEEGAVLRLTEHVLSLGHERAAYVGSDPTSLGGWLRYSGFAGALWGKGHELPLDWVFDFETGEQDEEQRLVEVFGQSYRPTVVVCSSDLYAARTMNVLDQAGLQCPNDVAVVGLGDFEFAPWLPSPLTTYAFDVEGFVEAAAARTQDLILGRTADSIKIGGRLVVRQSCGAGLRSTLHLAESQY